MNDKINKFLEENSSFGVQRAVHNILEVFKGNDGKITNKQFDAAFSSYNVVDGKRVRCKYIAYPPLSFMCANSDTNHAWHLNILQNLCDARVVDIKTVRNGLPSMNDNKDSTFIEYTFEGFDNE